MWFGSLNSVKLQKNNNNDDNDYHLLNYYHQGFHKSSLFLMTNRNFLQGKSFYLIFMDSKQEPDSM